jgi:hypothetical protein|tara:strand:- start:881 stop:1015 length:135 start_codon:yes stop_codon:yes gene_type:complete
MNNPEQIIHAWKLLKDFLEECISEGVQPDLEELLETMQNFEKEG